MMRDNHHVGQEIITRTPHRDGSMDSEEKPMRKDMNPTRPLGMSDHRSQLPSLPLVFGKVRPLQTRYDYLLHRVTKLMRA